MKKFILTLFITLLSFGAFAQDDSQWKTQPGHKLELNYNLFGRNYAQGVFYGSAGYGAGMWLSGNKTEWGIVGAFIASNLPIILENRLSEPETVIGRNLGAITVSASLTFTIEVTRARKLRFNQPMLMRRN
jgi:hypothetical protein